MAEAGSLDDAAQFLNRATNLAPRKAASYKYLGMVELRRNHPEQAVINLSTALALTPDDDVILGELGTAYYLMGNTSKAVACLSKALANNPSDEQSRYYLERARGKQTDDYSAASDMTP